MKSGVNLFFLGALEGKSGEAVGGCLPFSEGKKKAKRPRIDVPPTKIRVEDKGPPEEDIRAAKASGRGLFNVQKAKEYQWFMGASEASEMAC